MTGQPASAKVSPRSSRILAALVALIAAGSLLTTVIAAPGAALRFLPLHLLLLWIAWAVLWHPHVLVDDRRVVMVNIAREHEIPFGAIDEVDTRWGLVVTARGIRYQAWAAPAPGTLHTMRFRPDDLKNLPEASYIQGTVRPGDDPATDSGLAALHIRRALATTTRDANAQVRSHWQLPSLVIGAALLVATVVSLVSL